MLWASPHISYKRCLGLGGYHHTNTSLISILEKNFSFVSSSVL